MLGYVYILLSVALFSGLKKIGKKWNPPVEEEIKFADPYWGILYSH